MGTILAAGPAILAFRSYRDLIGNEDRGRSSNQSQIQAVEKDFKAHEQQKRQNQQEEEEEEQHEQQQWEPIKDTSTTAAKSEQQKPEKDRKSSKDKNELEVDLPHHQLRRPDKREEKEEQPLLRRKESFPPSQKSPSTAESSLELGTLTGYKTER